MIISGKHTNKKMKRIDKKNVEKKAKIDDSKPAINIRDPNGSENSLDEFKISLII